MIRDRYDLPLSTTSQAARDHYIDGVDRLLAAQPGFCEAFEQAVAADPGFALGHAGLARGRQYRWDMAGAREAMATAKAHAGGLDAREQGHVAAMDLLVQGQSAAAYTAIRAHVADFPRDALMAQACPSVFGLIGFSGRPGREAEALAFTEALLPHYGEDWWYLSQHAFALCEVGALDRASDVIDRSMALNPANAGGAHVRSHVDYESGCVAAGLAYLEGWMAGYDRAGYLHGHLSWHRALWALEQGDVAEMWRRVEADVMPGGADGLPINVLTDAASILYRAELAGEAVRAEMWVEVSAYASRFFPKPGIGFVDIHGALAHVMAGDAAALRRLVERPNPVTGDLVVPVADAFGAMARQDWAEAVAQLIAAMADHARLGGSRAQRDILEFSLVSALLRMGRGDEARRHLALRRPHLRQTRAVMGLEA